MNIKNFTTPFQEALSEAQSIALNNDHQYIEPLHIFMAYTSEPDSTIKSILQKSGVNTGLLQSRLSADLGRLPKVQGTSGDVRLSNDAIKLLNLSEKIATKRGDQYIASELFLLAILDDRGSVNKLLQVLVAK